MSERPVWQVFTWVLHPSGKPRFYLCIFPDPSFRMKFSRSDIFKLRDNISTICSNVTVMFARVSFSISCGPKRQEPFFPLPYPSCHPTCSPPTSATVVANVGHPPAPSQSLSNLTAEWIYQVFFSTNNCFSCFIYCDLSYQLPKMCTYHHHKTPSISGH